jgi:hypothetical protein
LPRVCPLKVKYFLSEYRQLAATIELLQQSASVSTGLKEGIERKIRACDKDEGLRRSVMWRPLRVAALQVVGWDSILPHRRAIFLFEGYKNQLVKDSLNIGKELDHVKAPSTEGISRMLEGEAACDFAGVTVRFIDLV